MPISITGTGTITGLSAGGLPDNCITTAEIAGSAITTAKLAQPITFGTAVATTSGTQVNFTDIPTWARRITVMFNNVNINGTSHLLTQVGTTSGIVSSGYVSYWTVSQFQNYVNSSSGTSGFGTWNDSNTSIRYLTLGLYNISGNSWISTHNGGLNYSTVNASVVGGGGITLSGSLDRIRISSATPTDTFGSGSINIMYEG